MATVKYPERVVATEKYEETGILFSDMVDVAATGTYTCNFTLPVGFFIESCVLTNVAKFDGDVSATVTIGDGTDVDRLNAGTPSVFTAVGGLYTGVPSGVRVVATAFRPVIIVTTNADFTSVTAGGMDIQVYGYQVL